MANSREYGSTSLALSVRTFTGRTCALFLRPGRGRAQVQSKSACKLVQCSCVFVRVRKYGPVLLIIQFGISSLVVSLLDIIYTAKAGAEHSGDCTQRSYSLVLEPKPDQLCVHAWL